MIFEQICLQFRKVAFAIHCEIVHDRYKKNKKALIIFALNNDKFCKQGELREQMNQHVSPDTENTTILPVFISRNITRPCCFSAF